MCSVAFRILAWCGRRQTHASGNAPLMCSCLATRGPLKQFNPFTLTQASLMVCAGLRNSQWGQQSTFRPLRIRGLIFCDAAQTAARTCVCWCCWSTTPSEGSYWWCKTGIHWCWRPGFGRPSLWSWRLYGSSISSLSSAGMSRGMATKSVFDEAKKDYEQVLEKYSH